MATRTRRTTSRTRRAPPRPRDLAVVHANPFDWYAVPKPVRVTTYVVAGAAVVVLGLRAYFAVHPANLFT